MRAHPIWHLAMSSAALCLLIALGDRTAAQDTTSLYVMQPDGGNARKVASPPGFRRAGHARWSHDGRRLAFHAWDGPPGKRQLFVVGANGLGLERVGDNGQFADWSPDDKQLTYQNRAGAWVENLDGRSRTFLGAGSAPRSSPSGDQIAFVENRTLVVRNLVDDSQVLPLEASWEVEPGFDWSPDGRRIALVAKRAGSTGLWIVDPAAKAAPRLRHSGSLMGQVAWSPDGKQLAVTLGTAIQLLAVDDDTPPKPIPGQVGNSRDPAWSPDGKSIAFSSTRPDP